MSENNVNCYEFDDYRLDVFNYQLLENGEPISLTQKSFELLQFLVENRGRILKKEELLDALWEGNFVEEANLTQHIYMLRKALKQKDRNKVYIETIPKNGYRFLADVREIIEQPIHISANGQNSLNPNSNEFLEENFDSGFINDPIHNSQDFKQPFVEPKKNTGWQNSLSNKYLAILGVLAVLGISAGIYFYFIQNTNQTNLSANKKSIAVLPFKQIDGEKDEKLGIGVADVLIARLANIEEITVTPTTSIMRFANEDNSDLTVVGEKLKVEYVLAGVIQKEDETVRVTTQLFNVKEKRQVWTQTIDEKYSDVFTLQDRISEKVANRVSLGFEINSSGFPFKQYTKNLEAYRAYSMGLSYWNMHNKPGFENAIRQFRKATEKDPHFVLAYAYLADSYAHTGHLSHLMTAEEARKKAEDAAKKALELDSECAEALAALALVYANKNKQKEAFELMQKSIQIKPNDAHSRHRLSWMYANKGEVNKALEQMKLAQRLDPQSPYINQFLGEMLYYSRKYDEAIKFFENALEIEPSSGSARWSLIKVYEQKEMFDKAEKELEKFENVGDNNKSLMLLKSRIFAKNEKREEAKELYEKVINNNENTSLNYLIAQTQIALGENELALQTLKGVIESVKDNIYILKYEPNLDPIRDDDKFLAVLKAKEEKQSW